MKRRRDEIATPEEEAVRFAWWAAFFATLIAVAALGLVSSAGAAVLPPGAPGLEEPADRTLAEEEAEAAEEDLCDWAEDEEEWEACIEAEEAEAEAMECGIESAAAKVTAAPARRRVLLTVRYSTYFPGRVTVRYGTRGGLTLGTERKRFGHAGTFRRRDKLSRGQMAKLLAARELVVELHAAGTPHHCREQLRLRLDLKRSTTRGALWKARSAG